MARFMIKASEYKNVCKAVNDRKLAELKKEIIEILKKQDEKEVKKAIDYFNSQELHYTHLEKSFTGKWIEKAGYGIGTVRIWKGKKYKKIAPGKWARVFEKEGRGTNIAIGKLIARVQKIDNVEDLMAFVMANKQRFVDENGVDLPVLDKLRAAVDERNGKVGSKGTSKQAEKKDEVSFDEVATSLDEMANKNEKGSKIIGGVKVSYDPQNGYRITHKAPTGKEITTGYDTIDEAHQAVMYRLNRIKNGEIQKIEEQEKPAETSKQTDYYEDISEVLTKDEKRRINEKVEEYSKENEWSIPAADMKKFVKDWQSALKETDKHAKAEKLYEIYSKLEDANWHDENKKLLAGNFEYFNDKYFKNMYGEEPEEKPAEKKSPEKLLKEMGFETMEKVSYNGDKWEVAGVSLDSDGNAVGVSLTPDRQSGNLKSSNVTVDDIGKIKKEKPAEKKKTFKQEMNELYDAQDKAWEGFESGSEIKSSPENSKKFYDKVKKFVDDNNIKLSQKHYDEIEEMNGHSFNEALELAGAYGAEKREKAIAKNKEINNKYKGAMLDLSMIDEFKESDDNSKTYWIQDSRGNRLTNEDAKKRLMNDIENLKEYKNEYLLDRLNPEDRKEIESEAEKHQNRSDAMKGNKNAYKGGLAKDTVKFVNAVKGEPYHDFETDINKFAIYSDDLGKQTGLVITQDIADIIDSHNEPSILDWKDAVAEEIHNKYPKIEASYIKLGLGGIRPGYRNGKKESIKVIPSKEEISSNKEKVAKRPSGKIATSNPDKLKPISSHEKVADGKVKMPYSKELSEEVKQLVSALDNKKKRSNPREILTKVYYDDGNLVATDGYSLKIIKVGELDGINNGSYVDIDNSKDGITITENKDFSKDHHNGFVPYKRVIPDGNKEKVVLDNKALISKIKELKKDGSISNKDPFVTFDVNGNDLMLDGVKVGDVSAANFEGDDSDFFNMDANILSQYLSGDTTELITSANTEKSMYIGNDSAVSIIMPQTKYERKYDSNGTETKEIRRKNYESLREGKKLEDEAKANKKAAQKTENNKYVNDLIEGIKKDVAKPDFGERMISKLKDWTTEQLQRLHKQANADIEHLMEVKDFNTNSFMTFTDKNYGVMPRVLIRQNYAMKQHPEIVREVERLLEERGVKVEKSLFGDFITDMLVDEVIEDEEEEEDEENESEYNDYSAEQPELFNSTEFLVREALNRRYNCM